MFNDTVGSSTTQNGIGYLEVLNDGGSWKYRFAGNGGELTEEVLAELQTKFQTLVQIVDRFDVFLNLYKQNVAQFDMYTYNELREKDDDNTLYSGMDDFVQSLSAEQMARLEVIENFTSYDMEVLLSALNEILVGSSYTPSN